jgi:type II secretory ATPase GspE/PulE/Tfp pilus assembly ATPase PilB-like protein
LPKQTEDEVWKELEKILKTSMPTDIKLIRPLKLFRGKGCVRCENTGYKGRVSIAEIVEMNPEVQRIIVSGGDIMNQVKREFQKQGFLSMKQDGIFKALRKVTTIEEVWDATRA